MSIGYETHLRVECLDYFFCRRRRRPNEGFKCKFCIYNALGGTHYVLCNNES